MVHIVHLTPTKNKTLKQWKTREQNRTKKYRFKQGNHIKKYSFIINQTLSQHHYKK